VTAPPSHPSGPPVPARRPRAGRRSFLWQWLSNPGQIGAVAPSSRHLARRMLEAVDLDRATVVVEYGPGTGAFTEHILPRLRPGTVFLPIELNPTMAAHFRRRFPALTLHERSVEDLPRILAEHGLASDGVVDAIVSGLPWAAFPEALQRTLLEVTRAALRPGGVMATFTYNTSMLTRAGRRFARIAAEYFTRIERGPTVLRNVPPAFVYRCVR
jgi:phosphatidylethanolamine/phosphatidyl-N-methylethanolamine N-methyltransferase